MKTIGKRVSIDLFTALLRSGLTIPEFVPALSETPSVVPPVLLAPQQVVKVHRHHEQHAKLYPFSLLGPLPAGIYRKHL